MINHSQLELAGFPDPKEKRILPPILTNFYNQTRRCASRDMGSSFTKKQTRSKI
jgi:hypothetical protein